MADTQVTDDTPTGEAPARTSSGGVRGWARSVQENDGQVREWNRFVERLHAVHRALVRDHDIRISEENGGYANDPMFNLAAAGDTARRRGLLRSNTGRRDRAK